jgi:hypothetical protein
MIGQYAERFFICKFKEKVFLKSDISYLTLTTLVVKYTYHVFLMSS